MALDHYKARQDPLEDVLIGEHGGQTERTAVPTETNHSMQKNKTHRLQRIGMKIKVLVGDKEFEGELVEGMNPETVEAIEDELPLEGTAQKWGKELYFHVPVNVDLEHEKRYVSKGDLGYWPDGKAFCIFYGKTPGSPSKDRIKPASPVNVVGRIENPEELERFGAGVTVKITEAE